MGRDLYSLYSLDVFYFISTHTPAWGATRRCINQSNPLIISTHTPAWGATADIEKLHADFLDFNSHARVGRDDYD